MLPALWAVADYLGKVGGQGHLLELIGSSCGCSTCTIVKGIRSVMQETSAAPCMHNCGWESPPHLHAAVLLLLGA
jgi:hypothetical protein